jgi:hypothetical protein
MYDPQTGKPALCIFCGSEEPCAHLLAVIDRTCVECTGGYAFGRMDELRREIECAFEAQLRSDGTNTSWACPLISELWTYAIDEYKNSGQLWLDGDVCFSLFIDLFDDAGGVSIPFYFDGGIPGTASVITIVYADSPHPKNVFEGALVNLRARLR